MKLLNINHLNKADHADIKEVLEFIETHDLSQFSGANNDVSDQVFFNVATYQSSSDEGKEWESHKRYIDVHVPIEGTERIYHNFLSKLTEVDYDEAGDSVLSKGDHASECVISKGDILVFYPEDAHKTGIIAQEAEQIHKVIFKVKI